jgi:hypothetical protein
MGETDALGTVWWSAGTNALEGQQQARTGALQLAETGTGSQRMKSATTGTRQVETGAVQRAMLSWDSVASQAFAAILCARQCVEMAS